MVSDSMVVMDNMVMENKMMQELLQLICVLHLLLSFHLDDGSRNVIRNVDGKNIYTIKSRNKYMNTVIVLV